MKSKELVEILSRYPEFNVKMRYADGNEFVDADVLKMMKVKYMDKEIVFYIDR